MPGKLDVKKGGLPENLQLKYEPGYYDHIINLYVRGSKKDVDLSDVPSHLREQIRIERALQQKKDEERKKRFSEQ